VARIYVEGWSPDYGSPLQQDERFEPAAGSVDVTVEVAADRWGARPGLDDGIDVVAFVDGVRRVDARLVLDHPELGPVPGICASVAVGAVRWERSGRRSEVCLVRVQRFSILARGRDEALPAVSEPGLSYQPASVAGPGIDDLMRELHTRMRRLEGEVASELARDGCFVVADGPLNDLAPATTIGYVKTHHVSYLGESPPANRVVGVLGPGERTPLFSISDYRRYSWYLRLARMVGGHSWSGIVRCEASGALPKEEVVQMADRSAALLPGVASLPHLDPRAPQNLVPIGALERELRRRLGDQGLVYRALRAAAMREEAPV
jgi:hypothetical protein